MEKTAHARGFALIAQKASCAKGIRPLAIPIETMAALRCE
jgi:hypothetical protein